MYTVANTASEKVAGFYPITVHCVWTTFGETTVCFKMSDLFQKLLTEFTCEDR